jgi:hypothetical protein
MQPNNQQGYYQPDQNQPVQPVTPPSTPVVQPLQQPAQVDPAVLQAALAEPTPPAPVAPTPAPQPVAEQPATDEDEDYEDEDDQLSDEPVTWVAKEYIHQEKGTLWFTIFAIVLAVLLAVSIFLMNSWSFAVLLAVIAVVVVVYSRRPPRELTYSLTDEGLTVDQTLHPFDGFKSFGVIRDGEEYSVMLIPTRRFQPGTTVYFPEEAGEDIVDILGSRLPMRDLHLDVVDRVVRLLRL